MPYHRPPDQRRPAERADEYKWFIRQQPCCICGDDVHVEAAHIRYSAPEVDKDETGMGRKADDRWTLPLCGRHHREQHTMNEREFWASHQIDPVKLALKYQVMVR
jgi:hypothetical protein